MKLTSKAILIAVLIFLAASSQVEAKKKLTRQKQKSSLSKKAESTWIEPRIRADRQAVMFIIGGMKYANTLDYNLTYTSDEIARGVQGTHLPSLGNTQKELVFGTCSSGVCTYHPEPKNMILEIISELKSGKTLTLKYRLNP